MAPPRMRTDIPSSYASFPEDKGLKLNDSLTLPDWGQIFGPNGILFLALFFVFSSSAVYKYTSAYIGTGMLQVIIHGVLFYAFYRMLTYYTAGSAGDIV